MSTFDTLFPMPTGGRNADDMGMPPPLHKPLPEPVAAHCCGSRLLPCKRCGADAWKSRGDQDCGDWEEEVFACQHCGNAIHVELPD